MTALFYSFTAKKSSQVAKHIIEEWGKGLEVVDVDKARGEDLAKYDALILGVPTWFDGELPSYWDEMVPEIENADLKGKKAAIYGLGDQKGYPENYVDGIGLMADILMEQGIEIVGHTSAEGYKFERSVSYRNGEFIGLALDFENQAGLSEERIKNWVKQLKKEF
ncbi:flavodoxin [Saccharicrinis sp. FJH54]|uniref:flavodoxin n=1 Tax=Saccharicrinis sp. FJH54 TaxID=3344665 RepID=UPI0035D4671C